MAGVPKLTQYDFSKIELTKPRTFDGGKGQLQFVNTKEFEEITKGSIAFIIPNATIAFTVKPYEDNEDNKMQKLKINIRFDEKNKYLVDLFDAIKRLETVIAHKLADNCTKWGLKPKDFNYYMGKCSSAIAEHPNKKEPNNPYADTLKINIPYDIKNPPHEIKGFLNANKNNEQIELNYNTIGGIVTGGSVGTFRVKIAKLWHSSNNWGISINLIDASVKLASFARELKLPAIPICEAEPETPKEEGVANTTGIKMQDEEDSEDDDDKGGDDNHKGEDDNRKGKKPISINSDEEGDTFVDVEAEDEVEEEIEQVKPKKGRSPRGGKASKK